MKSILTKQSIRSLYVSILLILFSTLAIAQNAADSDLSNKADTNKNWYGSGWLIGLVLILVLVVVFTLRRRRRG